ncbi:MAG: type 1 glutamine amidotransferase [Gammaproteobacteria bacterium]|jgi:GMP synthase-like glutamine amidotransferase
MKPVRIFCHVACEPPGYLGGFLDARGCPWESVCLDAGRDVPRDLDGVAALVFMGGPGNVNEPTDWMQRELELIRRAAILGTPVLGICLGAQLISKALGGAVMPAASLEVGWHRVEQLRDSAASAWFTGLPQRFEVFQWHAHTFSIPSGAVPLLRSDCAENQAFAFGNILAMQFHLEVTPGSVRELTQRFPGDLEDVSDCVQSAAEITADLEGRTSRLYKIADVVFDRWVRSVYGGL